MKKILMYINLFFCGICLFLSSVYAVNYSDSNNPGSGGGGSIGGANSGTNWQGAIRAIRIRVFRDGSSIHSAYFSLANTSSNCLKSISARLCETSSYNYSNVTTLSNATCASSATTTNLGCIVSSNLESTFEIKKYNGTYLDDYLKNNSYKELKEILSGMGYNESKVKDGDVVIIEPVTRVTCAGNFYFGTSTAMMIKNISYRGTSNNMCSSDDNDYDDDNKPDGTTFMNLFRSMSTALKISSQSSWKGDSSYKEFGYFKYDVSNIFDSVLTISYNKNTGSVKENPNYDITTTKHKIKYNSSDDPYNFSSFGLYKTGYHRYEGKEWNTKADGTGTSFNQSTEYKATDYSSSVSKESTSITLYAQWKPNKLTVNYYNGDTKLGSKTYSYATKYDNGLTDYATWEISKTGYTGTGYWKTSDNKYRVKQDTSFATGQALAQALGKDLSTENASVDVYAEWSLTPYTNTINHYMGGFKNKEGDSGTDNSALKIGSTTFSKTYNSTFTLDDSYAVKIPNGFYLSGKFGSFNVSNNGSWGRYSFPYKVTQKKSPMTFEYYYEPLTYNITYKLNGGTNNSDNPSTYNILYGVKLKEPTRPGFEFVGWYIGDEEVTTINEGAGATFKSVEEMYNRLKYRTTGNLTLEARWTTHVLNLKFFSNCDPGLFQDPNKFIINPNTGFVRAQQYLAERVYKKGISLDDYSYKGASFYFGCKGFIGSGDWNTEPDGTGININEDDVFESPYELASKLGVDIIEQWAPTVKLYAQWNVPFKIKKVNTSGSPIISRVYFSIYNDIYDCESSRNPYMTNVVTQNGKTHDDFSLPPGIYYIRETDVEDEEHYFVDDTCHEIYVGEGESATNEITITNVSRCESMVGDSADVHSRINIFQYDYPENNNLLNFRDKKTAREACTRYEPIVSANDDCMYSYRGIEGDFDGYNLSAFNDTIKDGLYDIGYCLTTFETKNAVSMPTNAVKAGTLIIGSNKENGRAITGVLKKTCYVYEDRTEDFDDTMTYGDYVSGIEIAGKPLQFNISNTTTPIHMEYKGKENGLNKFVGEISVDYRFNPVYVKKISGKPLRTDEDKELGKYTFIGYGVLSEFQDSRKLENFEDIYFDFEVKFKDKVNPNKNSSTENIFREKDYYSGACRYDIKSEIIKYNYDDNGKINIEFRIIDTNNPFNRTPKSNWNDGSNKNNSKNGLIKDYIINATNSYGIKKGESEKQTPKYIITLTSDIIEQIREYNDNNPYDNYELSCDSESGNCQNAFLKQFNIEKQFD